MSQEVLLALRKILPAKLPPSLSKRSASLYQVLSRYAHDGVGQRVHQTRWGTKGIEGCYWQVTRTRLKLEGKHGLAWGKLFWKGKPVTNHEERIPGGLKYTWREGVSKASIPQGPAAKTQS